MNTSKKTLVTAPQSHEGQAARDLDMMHLRRMRDACKPNHEVLTQTSALDTFAARHKSHFRTRMNFSYRPPARGPAEAPGPASAARAGASGATSRNGKQFYPTGSYFRFAHGRLSDVALSYAPRNSCRNSGGARL